MSGLTKLTAVNPGWLLADVYIDIASGKTVASRKEFSRMLKDCESGNLEIILTKSISRFGRDTVEILDALNQLKLLGVRVIFEQEQLDTADTDSTLIVSSRLLGLKSNACCCLARSRSPRWIAEPRRTRGHHADWG